MSCLVDSGNIDFASREVRLALGISLRFHGRGNAGPRPRVASPLTKWVKTSFLGVNTALLDGESHAIDSEHVSGNAVVDAMRLRVAHHVFKRILHDVFQLLV